MMRRATAADIPAILRIERTPGYDAFIGQDDAAAHAAWQTDADSAEYVWEAGGEVRGFALLIKLTNTHGTVQLKRIAVDAPGGGTGAAFLRAIIDRVFTAYGAHRLELDTSTENARARHVYEKHGFVHEGCVRDVWRMSDGRYVGGDLFSILRPEWEARR